MEDIDLVFHCAALKHVESGEYNPFEATQTNVVGSQNVIDACLAADVGTMILTSSDKAANPTSVMGASKLLAEKLSARRPTIGAASTTFASVRFGNVPDPRFRGRAVRAPGRGRRPVTVTDPSMTRFVMTTDRAVELAGPPRSPRAARCSSSRCRSSLATSSLRRSPTRPERASPRPSIDDGLGPARRRTRS
jgi:FlaA1/EpsC-like NDP-sugar epimerase